MSTLEVVVLGSSASAPAPGDACSGYLVRWGSTRLLLDCGSGTLGKLMLEGEHPSSLSAIAITHFHPDHYLELVTMRYALRYACAEQTRPLLLVPPGGCRFLSGLGSALRANPSFFADAFDLQEYDPSVPRSVADLRLEFCRTTHDEPNWAIGVTAPDGARLVYTGDTRVCEDLEAFAREADLLICESTYPSGVEGRRLPSDNHLTSAEAGQLARRANVRQLLLTHFWPEFPRECFCAGAEAAFGEKVMLARPGLCVHA